MSELDDLMRQLLTRMLTISYGKTQSFSSSTRGGEGAVFPPGESFPMHEKWASVYEQAHSLGRKRAVYEDAKAELEAWQGRSSVDRVKVTAEMEARWVIEDGEGHDVEAVALKFRMSVTRVRKLRLEAGRHAETGKPFVQEGVRAGAGLPERARVLKSQGLSQEVIAERLGVSQPTVHRLLKAPVIRRLASAA